MHPNRASCHVLILSNALLVFGLSGTYAKIGGLSDQGSRSADITSEREPIRMEDGI